VDGPRVTATPREHSRSRRIMARGCRTLAAAAVALLLAVAAVPAAQASQVPPPPQPRPARSGAPSSRSMEAGCVLSDSRQCV
jgi:hypothetical protein